MRTRINKYTGKPVRTLSHLFNKSLEAGLTREEANRRVRMLSIKSEANLLFNN